MTKGNVRGRLLLEGSHWQSIATRRRTHGLPERLYDWDEFTDDEEEDGNSHHEDGLMRNEEEVVEEEVCAVTLHDVNHTNLELLESILELADFIMTENCCLVNLTPEYAGCLYSGGLGRKRRRCQWKSRWECATNE